MSQQNAVSISRGESGETQISCHTPNAATVFIAGTFNEWKPDATPMVRGSDGTWTATLPTPPGRHEFKFVVDGQWCCEPGIDDHAECPGCCHNNQGTQNRVIEG